MEPKSLKSISMFLFLFFALGARSKAQLVLYDDFRSPTIDASKWVSFGPDFDVLDAQRQLVGGLGDRHLRLAETAYATTADDFGASGGGFGLYFPRSGDVTEVSFDVTVNDAVAVGCQSNPNGQIVTGAELRGRFFNTEPFVTSQLGDIEAVIAVNRNATDAGPAMEVLGFYQRCDDAGCGARTTLSFNRLGFVLPHVPATLHMKWDQPNHQFVFQLNNKPLVFAPYSVPDTSLPFFGPIRILDLAHVVPHCTTTPRPFASIDAFFDNVRVNP
jgi:hypothetical protein